MQLLEISSHTEQAFFTCLHLEEAEDRAFTRHRRRWFADCKARGYKALVLVLQDGDIAGKCHTVPIEHSPFVGRDLLAILCLYVHMYEHGIGDQRGRGYGRFMLDQVEQDALQRGFNGVVAWATDWSEWNPVSFYEQMGYTRADQEDKVVAVWKQFAPDAAPPRLLRLDRMPEVDRRKVSVLVADNAWCNSNHKLETVRDAIRGLEEMVTVNEIGPPCQDRIIHLGHVGGVYLDGKPYRPYQLIGSSDELRAEILRLYEAKQAPRLRP